MRKLLLLTYHFPPTAASGTFRILGFARHLPSYGWQPVVVAPPQLPWEPIDEELVRHVPPEVIVNPVPYPAHGLTKPLRRFARHALWLPKALAAARRAVEEHRPEAVLTSSP